MVPEETVKKVLFFTGVLETGPFPFLCFNCRKALWQPRPKETTRGPLTRIHYVFMPKASQAILCAFNRHRKFWSVVSKSVVWLVALYTVCQTPSAVEVNGTFYRHLEVKINPFPFLLPSPWKGYRKQRKGRRTGFNNIKCNSNIHASFKWFCFINTHFVLFMY